MVLVNTVMVLVLVAAAAGPAGGAAQQARIAPPDRLDCPRDHLTVFTGRVRSMRRERDRTIIEIRTDWDTSERVTVIHPKTGDPSPWFLLNAAPFHADDWRRIESAPNQLRPAVRASAWVCADGRNPVIQWDSPSEPASPRR
jgi:hypothetical protein